MTSTLECDACGSTEFTFEDSVYVCINCQSVKADVREERDDEDDQPWQNIRSNTRDRRNIIVLNKKKGNKEHKPRDPRTHYGDEKQIVREVVNVLQDVASVLASSGVVKEEIILGNLRAVWQRWVSMAIDVECYSHPPRSQSRHRYATRGDHDTGGVSTSDDTDDDDDDDGDDDSESDRDDVEDDRGGPPSENRDPKDVLVECSAGIAAKYQALPAFRQTTMIAGSTDSNFSIGLPFRLGFMKRRRRWPVRPSVIMGPVVPCLSKDLILSLLWIALVNSGVPVLPIDVALMLTHGPLLKLVRPLSDALPIGPKKETWPTGSTIQRTASALVHCHGFRVCSICPHSLVNKLVASVGFQKESKQIESAAHAILLMFEKEEEDLYNAFENEVAALMTAKHLEIVGSASEANGVYVKVGKHAKMPFYQKYYRHRAEVAPLFLWFVGRKSMQWVVSGDPSTFDEHLSASRYVESWSHLKAIGTIGGRIEIREVQSLCRLSPDQVQIEACIEEMVNGVYTLIGDYDRMPIYVKCDVSEKHLYLYYHRDECKEKEGWMVGSYPESGEDPFMYDFWRDLDLPGRKEGALSICGSMIGEERAAKTMRMPHPLHEGHGYPVDIFVAAAVVAASEQVIRMVGSKCDGKSSKEKLQEMVKYMKRKESYDPAEWGRSVRHLVSSQESIDDQFAEISSSQPPIALSKCSTERWQHQIGQPKSTLELVERLVGVIRGWAPRKLACSKYVALDIQSCATDVVRRVEAQVVELYEEGLEHLIPNDLPQAFDPQLILAAKKVAEKTIDDFYDHRFDSVEEPSAKTKVNSSRSQKLNRKQVSSKAQFVLAPSRKKRRKIRSKVKSGFRDIVDCSLNQGQLRTVVGETMKSIRGWNLMMRGKKRKYPVEYLGECLPPSKLQRKSRDFFKIALVKRGVLLKGIRTSNHAQLQRMYDITEHLKIFGVPVPSGISGLEALELLLAAQEVSSECLQSSNTRSETKDALKTALVNRGVKGVSKATHAQLQRMYDITEHLKTSGVPLPSGITGLKALESLLAAQEVRTECVAIAD